MTVSRCDRGPAATPAPALLAISDLHVSHAENRPVVEALRSTTPGDWLIVAGDVAERAEDVVRDPVQLRGQDRARDAATGYGHLHIPRTTVYDGVPFLEVSLGYPREWRRRGLPDPLLRPVPARRPA